MPDEQRVARTTRCSDPAATVVKQLFGTAAKCGRPTCNEILYRMENGRPALNCRIAHIRASAPNGPRADPFMTCSEVNAFDNLVLLCLFDASLVDDNWEDYPVEMLAEWKQQQIEQATLLGVARQPTDDEISELIVESREHDSVTRSASVDLARSVRQLRSVAERTRAEPQQILRERDLAERQLNRGFVAFDPETGERSLARLSRDEERRFAERIADALRRSRGPVEAAADSVLADAAGVAAAAGSGATDARSWVERSVAEVVRLTGEWNDELGAGLDQLDGAAAALSDTAAGRTTHVPPPPEPPAPPEPSALELFVERCREIHEHAARHVRVEHLEFDAALHADVLALAPDCAGVPAVPSFMAFGIDNNAALAAAILKNADDEQFALAVDEAEALLPEAAAAQHLRQLHFLASERGWSGRLGFVSAAAGRLSATIIDQVGSHDFWGRNIEHGTFILRCAEATVGAENVTAALRRALTDPTLLDPILLALAETVENVDSSTMESLGIARRYSEPRGPIGGLPQFIPEDAVCAAIEKRWPAGPSARGPEIDRLAAEFRVHHCSPHMATS
jgi:hypothetical protein